MFFKTVKDAASISAQNVLFLYRPELYLMVQFVPCNKHTPAGL